MELGDPGLGAQDIEAQRDWYGHTLVFTDAVGLALLGSGLGLTVSGEETAGAVLLVPGVLSLTLGGAVMHLVQRGPRAAGISLALRVGIPAVAAAPGLIAFRVGLEDPDSGFVSAMRGLFAAVALGGVGFIAGAVLDYYCNAYADPAPSAAAGVAPTVAVLVDGTPAFGLAGRF